MVKVWGSRLPDYEGEHGHHVGYNLVEHSVESNATHCGGNLVIREIANATDMCIESWSHDLCGHWSTEDIPGDRNVIKFDGSMLVVFCLGSDATCPAVMLRIGCVLTMAWSVVIVAMIDGLTALHDRDADGDG